jgi:hypothetical protein
VASYGNDAGACGASYISPCKTLQRGVNRASGGDTVFIEYTGDHGPATITKALTIIAVLYGGISAPAGLPCLTIAAGADDVISIKGLICEQTGTTRDGIVFNSGKRLRLEQVDFTGGGTGTGVRFQPSGNALLDIADCNFRAWGAGLRIAPRSGADVGGAIEHTTFAGNVIGIASSAGAGSIIGVACDSCRIVGGAAGIDSKGAGSVVRVRNSLVGDNKLGLNHPDGGQIVSLKSNAMGGNIAKGTFTSTVPPL